MAGFLKGRSRIRKCKMKWIRIRNTDRITIGRVSVCKRIPNVDVPVDARPMDSLRDQQVDIHCPPHPSFYRQNFNRTGIIFAKYFPFKCFVIFTNNLSLVPMTSNLDTYHQKILLLIRCHNIGFSDCLSHTLEFTIFLSFLLN